MDHLDPKTDLNLSPSNQYCVRLHAFHRATQDSATATRRSYRTALVQYAEFNGFLSTHLPASNRQTLEDTAIARCIPADPEHVAAWLAALDLRGCKPTTIAVRLAAIKAAHKQRRLPFDATLPARVLAGIKRERGTAPRQAAALMAADLRAIVPTGNALIDKRDRALLLLGWAAALRRSELVGLDTTADYSADATGYIDLTDEGARITLLKSKTDQEGAGQSIAVPYTGTAHCPVTALQEWIKAADIDSGPVFRSIAKGSRLRHKRLPAEAVGLILKKRAAAAGLSEPLTAHSLRAGFITECAEARIDLPSIQATTRHADINVLARYVRSRQQFKQAALRRLNL